MDRRTWITVHVLRTCTGTRTYRCTSCVWHNKFLLQAIRQTYSPCGIIVNFYCKSFWIVLWQQNFLTIIVLKTTNKLRKVVSTCPHAHTLVTRCACLFISRAPQWSYITENTRGVQMNFALSWFPCSYSSKLSVIFQYGLPWHQYTVAYDIRVLRSFRKIRLKHAPLRSRQQAPWRHCCFQISSVVVHI